VINGDGEYSRDFTYIDNVIQMNIRAMETNNPEAVNTVYKTTNGERTTLNQLVGYLKEYLSELDPAIAQVEILHGPNRAGDITHSLAKIDNARNLLEYDPKFSIKPGLVGGHCRGVDTYYLAQASQRYVYIPEIIFAGRRMNDGMGEYEPIR
jgi:UDP-N-acetylglucosamine 4-epimerase